MRKYLDQYELVNLYNYSKKGLSHLEISKKVGISLGTVYQNLKKINAGVDGNLPEFTKNRKTFLTAIRLIKASNTPFAPRPLPAREVVEEKKPEVVKEEPKDLSLTPEQKVNYAFQQFLEAVSEYTKYQAQEAQRQEAINLSKQSNIVDFINKSLGR